MGGGDRLYTLLSAFPLILGVIALAGKFVDPEWATEQIVANLGDFVPEGEGFIAYLGYSGREFDVIYGSLAIGVILVFWAWIVGIILLLGAEITSHLQALLVDGLTPEEVWKHHIKRSPDRMNQAEDGGGAE